MAHSLSLYVRSHGEGDSPFSPGLYVAVQRYTRDESDAIVITPECENLQELEAEIERLHTELEAIRAQARREFSKV
ncbi:MAG: hypothetical protein ACWGN7_06665 [Thermodesulfovibrionales bacterium]